MPTGLGRAAQKPAWLVEDPVWSEPVSADLFNTLAACGRRVGGSLCLAVVYMREALVGGAVARRFINCRGS